MEPVVAALAAEGCPYVGILYAGLMLTQDGLKVIEFNCRFGDPEAQVILPRIETDLLDLMLATVAGNVDDAKLRVSPEPCVGVVVASGGYPEAYQTGFPVAGLEDTLERSDRLPRGHQVRTTTRRPSRTADGCSPLAGPARPTKTRGFGHTRPRKEPRSTAPSSAATSRTSQSCDRKDIDNRRRRSRSPRRVRFERPAASTVRCTQHC